MEKLTLQQAVEWRWPVWQPAVEQVIAKGGKALKPGSKVLELGYNSGAMSCYLHQRFQWNITGYEVDEGKQAEAIKFASSIGLNPEEGDGLNFLVCPPEKSFEIPGEFDGIFIKSFLYHNKSLEDYLKWVHFLASKLKKGGVLMAIENGQGRFIDWFYRQKVMKNCSWKDNTFFSQNVKNELDQLFSNVEVDYFGGVSQFLTPIPSLAQAAMFIEQRLWKPREDNCFIASIYAVK